MNQKEKEISQRYGIIESPQHQTPYQREISHEYYNTRSPETSSSSETFYEKRQKFCKQKYGVSLSSVKKWCKHYDGDRRSLKEGSRRPHSHPERHTKDEEIVHTPQAS